MSDYDEIRQRIEKRHKERLSFFIHVAVYFVVNFMLWVLWFMIAQDNPTVSAAVDLSAEDIETFRFPWPLVIMFGWGIGLLSHYINYYFKYGAGAARRQNAIDREVEEEIARRNVYEKPKNDSRVRISEDGELEEVDDTAAIQKLKRRQ
jgi:hypothetical protein